MIQIFIFHGYAIDGQRACQKASAKVNRFLQVHQVTNPQVSTNYTASYNASFDNCICECVVTVAARVEEPLMLTEEDYCEDEPQKWIDIS